VNATHRTLIALLALAATLLVGWRTLAWRRAAAEFASAASFRTAVSEKTARIGTLRAQPAVSGFGARPADDVIPLANRVLDTAAIPLPRLRSVQPEADRAIPDDKDGRRAATVRLAIEPLTIPELGGFLTAWRSTQQVWSVSRIDLSAMSQGQPGAKASGNYRATITVTATYLDDQAPPPTPSPLSAHSALTPSPLLGNPQ
jgi:hypothetical protein